MAMANRSTIVGVFEDRFAADRAIDELRRAGFRDDQIGVASRYEDESIVTEGDDLSEEASAAGTGAISGALAGAGLGALAGLGILAGVIPVVGPAIAGGTLGILLSNAAAGAGIAGLTGALIGAGVSEEEAEYYEGEFQGGRTIVTVHPGDRVTEASEILRRHGAYDMQTRGETMSARSMGTSAHGDTAVTGGETIELREERLRARTQPHKAGEVHVTKDVVSEHKAVEVPVEREEIVIERRAADGRSTTGNVSDLKPGEELRIPVKEEEVIVDKDTVVREEVSVGKRVVQDHERVEGDVRQEELRVERKGDVKVENKTNRPK